jgi:hypothetical protein
MEGMCESVQDQSPGNRNARQHGLYAAEHKARRKRVMDLVRAGNRLLREIDKAD